MSVRSHLKSVANSLYISRDSNEYESIDTSIETIERRLNLYFDNKMEKGVQFGSSTRGTMLPRSADPNSDVDYMVIFNNEDKYKPQTFMDRLRRFAEKYYSRSEIRQSHPTVVLELNHIMFDLVPAYDDFWSGLKIPAPNSDYKEWISTDPKGFKQELTRLNKESGYTLKRAIRLVKYWNARKERVYTSFELEKRTARNTYLFADNIWEYFKKAMEALDKFGLPSYKKRKVRAAQQRVADAKSALRNGNTAKAERKIRKVVPEL